MDNRDFVFVEIDMRNDFADDPRAALPVPGTYGLVGKMRAIEDSVHRYREQTNIIEVYDDHMLDDPVSQDEFKTFPPHCIRGTWGHNRIPGLAKSMIAVSKNTYDFWKPKVELEKKPAIRMLDNAGHIIVGGVVTGICVKAFIDGAGDLCKKIIIISDCVANLEGVPGVKSTKELFEEWSNRGVRIMTFNEFVRERM